jgi:cell migration-inducing and hyaluronan-binding protein
VRAGSSGWGTSGAPAGRGGFGRGPAAAPEPPVVLSRNGKDYTVTQSNVRAGTEIKVTTERPEMSLSLRELDKGSWVIFELPGFTTAASGTQQNSLDALRKARDTSYFKDKDALWVKVVSAGPSADRNSEGFGGLGAGSSIQVSR